MLVRSRVAEADLASESEEAPGRMSKMLVETAKAAPAEPAAVAVAAEEDLASKLKLQGIIYNGSRSSMFINGRSFRLGDEISGARIVAVQPEEVILEKAGLQHRLRLQ
jgi:MSHA biogenesis protein MshK